MQNALTIDGRPEPMPRSGALELVIGVRLAPPWAWSRNGCVGGIEVDDAREFARWLGRPPRFVVLDTCELTNALDEGEIDLAIGDLADGTDLSGVSLSCRYAADSSDDHVPSPDTRRCHVWAMPRRSAALYATLAFYLSMVRREVSRLATRLH